MPFAPGSARSFSRKNVSSTARATNCWRRSMHSRRGSSDVPIIVLTAPRASCRGAIASGVEVIASRGNVTCCSSSGRFEVATLVTVDFRSALRARERQYDVYEHMQSLSAARAEAEAANRAKVEFLAMMSHELRTPLNAIGGYAELLEMGVRGPLNDAQRADLGKIQKSQRHLLGLINGVLNFARIETGRVPYDITNVEMDELLATAESLVAPQAHGRGLRLEFPGCSARIIARADRENTQHVVVNLLTNAVKFTDAGRARPPRVHDGGSSRGRARRRHRARHSPREDRSDLRAVHPGRQPADPHTRRRGTWAVDQPRSGARHGRRSRGAE